MCSGSSPVLCLLDTLSLGQIVSPLPMSEVTCSQDKADTAALQGQWRWSVDHEDFVQALEIFYTQSIAEELLLSGPSWHWAAVGAVVHRLRAAWSLQKPWYFVPRSSASTTP